MIDICKTRESVRGYRSTPLAVLCCIDHSQEWVRPADNKQYGTIDIAIAAEHICLAAAERGLGSCWICNFDVDKASGLFDLPDNLELAVLVKPGYLVDIVAARVLVTF